MEQKGIFVVHHYGSFHYGNWQEATQKWKMEKKGPRLANDICHYCLAKFRAT